MKKANKKSSNTNSLVKDNKDNTIIARPYQDIEVVKNTKGPLCISYGLHGYKANEVAIKAIINDKSSLDAVELGINEVENDPDVTSVGYGGLPDAEGNVTLDASIMDWNGNAGAVAFLKEIKNPISVARLVMEKTPHVILVGEGASHFALSNGFKKQNLLTPKAEKAWKEWKKEKEMELHNQESHDTIGLLAIDHRGNISGGTSTSGVKFSLYGRVGDTPIIGAGLFVDNEIGGACSTGFGEISVKSAGSFLIVEKMREGYSPQEACEYTVRRINRKHYYNNTRQICFLAMNKKGEIGAYSLKKGFKIAIANTQESLFFQSDYLEK